MEVEGSGGEGAGGEGKGIEGTCGGGDGGECEGCEGEGGEGGEGEDGEGEDGENGEGEDGKNGEGEDGEGEGKGAGGKFGKGGALGSTTLKRLQEVPIYIGCRVEGVLACPSKALEEHLMRGAIKRYHQRRASGSLIQVISLFWEIAPQLIVKPLGTQSVTQSKLIKGDRTSAYCQAPWYAISHAIKAHQGRSHLGLVTILGTQCFTQSKLIKGDRTLALSSPFVRNQSRNQSSSREIAPQPCQAP